MILNIFSVFTLVVLTGCGQLRSDATGNLFASGNEETSLRKARFAKYLSRLDGLFSKAHSNADVIKTIDDPSLDLRGNAYRLEALLKLYKKSIGVGGEDVFKELKALEDALGKYGETREATQFAEKVKAPAPVALALQKRRTAAAAELIHFLQQQKWIGAKPSKAQVIAAQLDQLEWPDVEDDKEFFVKRLADRYEDLAKTNYPRNRTGNSVDSVHQQLENWTHEMRRDYRWPNIMMAASDGLIQRSSQKCSIASYQSLSGAPIARLPTRSGTATRW